MMPVRNKYLGTSDFSVENKLVYRNAKEYTDVYLFDTEKEFTILLDMQVVSDVGTAGTTLDFISGGNVTNGNFGKGLGIRRYGRYLMDYCYNHGPYITFDEDNLPRRVAYRYKIAASNNITGWIQRIGTDLKKSTETASYIQSDNPIWFGGSNGATPVSDHYGRIGQAMFYYRALSDSDVENYINNGIIP